MKQNSQTYKKITQSDEIKKTQKEEIYFLQKKKNKIKVESIEPQFEFLLLHPLCRRSKSHRTFEKVFRSGYKKSILGFLQPIVVPRYPQPTKSS